MSGALDLLVGAGGASFPVFVAASAVAVDAGAGGDLVIAKPAGVSVGDLMLAIMAAEQSETFTGDTGWTEIADYNANPGLRAAWKVVGGSEPSSYTFTASASNKSRRGVIIAYSNAAFDVVGSFGSASSTSPCVAPAITMTADGFLIAAYASADIGRTFATPTDMASVAADSSTRPSLAVFSQLVGPGSTGTKSSQPSASATSAGILIGIKGT